MISVAMATYNGERYIEAQIKSILQNLQPLDEVVISDDGSTDETVNILKGIGDNRIKIYDGPRQGVVKNFENAIKLCAGEIIFLSDQDDIWYHEKVRIVLNKFQNDISLIEHDAKVVDAKGDIIYPSFFKYRRVRKGLFKNTMRNTYHGCLMAFRAEMKEYIIPFPEKGCLHDQWIGIICEMEGKTLFLNDILMEYKRHDDNVSTFKHLPIRTQLINRIYLIKNIIIYCYYKRRER